MAVRISPAPVRRVHMGLCRMAILNVLLAMKYGLDIVLRFDDLAPGVDGQPTQDGAVAWAFRWLGLPPMESPWRPGDRGPYLQSQRIEVYKQAALSLLDSGAAYACGCTSTFQTGGCSCERPAPQGLRPRELPEGAAVRFFYPGGDDIELHDLAQGRLRIPRRALDGNPVLWKSSGRPSFYLSYAVDDHLMGIEPAIFERSPVATAYVKAIECILYGKYGEVLHTGRVRGSLGRDLKTMTMRGHPVAYLQSYVQAGISAHGVRALLIRSLLKGGRERLSLDPSLPAIARCLSLADLRCNDAVLPVEELGAIERAVTSSWTRSGG